MDSYAQRKLHFQKTFRQEHMQSLIDDARCDTALNANFDATMITEAEETFSKKEENPIYVLDENCSIVYRLKDGADQIPIVLQFLKKFGYKLVHMEARKSLPKDDLPSVSMDLFLELRISSTNRTDFFDKLKTIDNLEEIIKTEDLAKKEHWFPRHISDMDKCNHLVIKFQPEMATHHPGFHDPQYRKRRMEITEVAFNFKHGQSIPKIKYTNEEIDTWRITYTTLRNLYSNMACKEQMMNLQLLEKEGIYSPNKIPQLEDVSQFLKSTFKRYLTIQMKLKLCLLQHVSRGRSGFQLRPVAGLLSARDFLASLAFRVFQCTQYIRHHSKPLHTPEPDCIHELLGHVPVLCDREFAEFSQEIGLASLGASNADIEKLATVYWFTIEFGLCRQNGKTLAFGAALLSSYGELKHALSDVPEQRRFDPHTAATTPYNDDEYQPIYYVADSVQDMKEKLRQFTHTISRPYQVRYDPYTSMMEILDSRHTVSHLGRVIRHELENMENALNKMIDML